MSTARILQYSAMVEPRASSPTRRRPDAPASGDVAALLSIEAAVARRWAESSRRVGDHEPCPRNLTRAVLLQAGDHWGGRVWAAAAALVVCDTLSRWQAAGVSPARVFSWLVELEGYLQAETEAVFDPEAASALRMAAESLLFETFPARWRNIAAAAPQA